MSFENNAPIQTVSLTSIINTPVKKLGFAALLLSQLFIFGSPFIGGGLGSLLDLSLANVGSLVFSIWLVGEALFFGALFVLGKPVVTLCVTKLKLTLKRDKS